MERLLEKIMSVQSRSDSVNTSLFDKREHIEKLHRTCNLLRKVQLSETLGVGLRYDKHEKLRYTEGLVEIREDYIEDSHKGETKSGKKMM